MKAIVNHEYGAPDDLKLQEIDKPGVGEDSVLVRVRAASVNPYDWHVLRGLPYFVRLTEGLRRPKHPIPGVDVAGLVEAVGEKVTAFQPGDEVFGGRSGAFAEYVCGVERNFTTKPAGLSFEQAGLNLGAGYALICALFWGLSTVAGRGVMTGMPLRLAASLRVVVGLICMAFILLVYGKLRGPMLWPAAAQETRRSRLRPPRRECPEARGRWRRVFRKRP